MTLDPLACEFRRDGDALRFRASGVERGAVVLDLGHAHVRGRGATAPGACP